MIKYALLHRFLLTDPTRCITLAFDQVAVLTDGRPQSAYDWRAWWANERAGTHSHARAWLDAGRTVTAVDPTGGYLTFSRKVEAAAAYDDRRPRFRTGSVARRASVQQLPALTYEPVSGGPETCTLEHHEEAASFEPCEMGFVVSAMARSSDKRLDRRL